MVFHPLPADRHHERVIECRVPTQPGGADGPLRLLVASLHNGNLDDPARLIQLVRRKAIDLAELCERTKRPLLASEGLLLDRAWLARQGQPGQRLGLALGACRQRPMLVDRRMADRAMGHLNAALDEAEDHTTPPDHAPIDAVLLAGDQVYVDSQVNHGDAGAMRRVYLDAHHEAWSAPNQRKVMCRRPVLMVVDDHEFRNDYNDQTTLGRPKEFRDAKAVWQRYQIDAGPTLPRPGVSWRSTRLGGFPFFLADTRSERHDPPCVNRQQARIMGPVQMRALRQWLSALHRSAHDTGRPKLIVLGTPVAPWFRHEAHGLGTDGWQRFPHSLARLLGFIARHQIQQVVFLSGDYHLHADCDLLLQAPGKPPVQARSIVTGGLYSPYPFANATRGEWLDGPGAQDLQAGATRWGYCLRASQPGNGYTRLTLSDTPNAQGERVLADFVVV
jgi:cholesterol oxidase